MKSPFRVLRRKLFEEGKLLSYIGYAVGELLLIIFGILIALKIADWNDYRRDRLEETIYIQRLLADFEQSILNQENEIEIYQEKCADVHQATIWTYEKSLTEDNFKEFSENLRRFYRKRFFPVTTDTINELMTTGKITLITSHSLRQDLAVYMQFLQSMNDASDASYTLITEGLIQLDRLLEFAPPEVDRPGERVVITSIETINSKPEIYDIMQNIDRRHHVILSWFKRMHEQTKVVRDTLQEYIENH